MLDQEFSDDVMNLRPRKLRLGRDVERLLEGVCGAEEDSGGSRNKQALRPNADSANAIRCAACGRVEYITREHCRCGHYLVGQIEDEYFAYERGLADAHERLSTAAERKLKPLRLATLAGLPFMVWPLLYAFLYGSTASLTIWLWTLPGIAIYGLFGVIQAKINAKRNASAKTLQAATFEQFLIDRAPVTST
ncbi:hypothetical protein M3N55_10165 [Roseibaca sp. V10]|uniref:Positive regulator of sigma(E), RseC/MucC n=1 Tax=Roseinatronobacter domitianus TaxID=2940293 RepID=A0ABT0M3X3_9RHOB|nr:hypothetical protein [Roseibaca domitiana]MCL1629095.1 hypothetical protein [Roseibaca domitiana]